MSILQKFWSLSIVALPVNLKKITATIAPHLDKFFFIALFCLLIKKVRFSAISDLIYHYPYMTYDAYQWITDSLHYLTPSIEVTQRNPGLPLVFAFLRVFASEDFYPYLSAALIWFFYLAAYWLLLPLVNRRVALFTTFSFLFVFKIHSFFDYVLADPWCLVFSMAAFGSLYRLDRHPKYFIFFAVFLGLAFNFQFAPVFMAPAFAFRLWQTCDFKWIQRHALTAIYGCVIFLAIVLPQFLYKWMVFGSPLYSQVIHFPLLKFHYFGLPYYGMNYLAFLGYPMAILVAIGWWKTLQKPSPNLSFTLSAFFLNFVIWILVYSWLDTRFLLYLLPQWVVFFAIAVERLNLLSYYSIRKKGFHTFLVAVGFTYFALNLAAYKISGFDGASLPLTPQNILRFSGDPVGAPYTSYALSLQGLNIQNNDDAKVRSPLLSYFRYYRNSPRNLYQIPQEYIDDSKAISILLTKNSVLPPVKLGACGDLGAHYETRMRLFWTTGLNISECRADSPWRVIRSSELPALESSQANLIVVFRGSQISLVKKIDSHG